MKKRLAHQKRFQENGRMEPSTVAGLHPKHPAMLQARTLFPKSVISPKDSPKLLISGYESRKLGKRVEKGEWSGFEIYSLALEERATCPASCFHWSTCYGNAMPFSRRHKADDSLLPRLRSELAALQRKHPRGFVVRLHVLGDFYSMNYLYGWAQFLREFPALHVFGDTAHNLTSEIGAAIKVLTNRMWRRFAIRFSSQYPQKQGSFTLWEVPESDHVQGGLVCPAQTGKTNSCATCGLCWAEEMRGTPIAFIAHGAHSTKSKFIYAQGQER